MRFTKITVLLGAALTLCCAALVVGLQLANWVRHDEWQNYPISSVLSASEKGTDTVYTTASEIVRGQSFLDSVLDIPLLVLLLFAAALQLGFYFWLTTTQKQLSAVPDRS